MDEHTFLLEELATRPGDKTPRLALVGELAGVPRCFPLALGRNQVGALPTNDVFLDAVGVSRRHAQVTVAEGRVVVEDLASKNGTFVNGARIGRQVARIGDQVAFGTVVLTLGQVADADLELGIRLDQAPAIDSAAGRDTTLGLSWSASDVAGRWLAVVEAFVERFGCEREGYGVALETLVERLGARGACLIELEERRPPVVVACHGAFDAGSLDADTLRSLCSDGPRAHDCEAADRTPLTIAILPGATRCSFLALWGRPPFKGAWDPLLAMLLRLVARFRGDDAEIPAAKRARKGPRELVFSSGHVAGESPRMKALYRQLEALAGSTLPVLILGETGAGKEEIARVLHRSNRERRGSFVAINCAALPAELLEAELFGIGDRVATGVAARPGQFQLAEDGTLFLDEVGDMPAPLQAKLLRALETAEIQPLGSPPVTVDVRLVAATNIHLEDQIEAGTFRRDLYYRLAGVVLTVPPLRERRQDIPALVERFLRDAAREAGKSIPGMTVAALKRLVERPWTGNVRELRHVVQRLVYLCPERQAIDAAFLAAVEAQRPAADGFGQLEDTSPDVPELPALDTASSDGSLHLEAMKTLRLADIEERLIAEALARTEGNKTQAAQLLGISREALRRRLNR